MEFDIESYLSTKKNLVDNKLESILAGAGNTPTRLEESIRYSALAGGKRLRPILCIAAYECFGGADLVALPIACAIEMIHTYSLIHDDLPSMDDDSLRRGVPTNHTVYGEATAILAGDALLTDAFRIIVDYGRESGLGDSVISDLVLDISRAAGSSGMIKGQAMDLLLEGNAEVGVSQVEEMHSLKTGALIELSVTAGARVGGAIDSDMEKLAAYARSIGLAYQIVDDVLDIEGGEEIGKEPGADVKREKSTYPEILGLENSKRKAHELTENALRSIETFGESADALRAIAVYLGGRRY